MRQVHGAELLAAQGVPFHALHVEDFSHEQLSILAGNAFNGFAAVAMVIATFVTVDLKPRLNGGEEPCELLDGENFEEGEEEEDGDGDHEEEEEEEEPHNDVGGDLLDEGLED